MKNEQKRAYYEMLKPAVERLRGKNPEEIARKAGVLFNSEYSVLEVPILGKTYEFHLPTYTCRGEIEEWIHLVTLHYLDLADGTPVSWRLITFGNMKDGLIRGTGFDRTADIELQRILKGKNPEQIKNVCQKLGTDFAQSGNSDVCVVLPFLPHIPLVLKVWFADEEFDATGKLLLTASADHYLTIEDAVTAGEIVLKQIKIQFEKERPS